MLAGGSEEITLILQVFLDRPPGDRVSGSALRNITGRPTLTAATDRMVRDGWLIRQEPAGASPPYTYVMDGVHRRRAAGYVTAFTARNGRPPQRRVITPPGRPPFDEGLAVTPLRARVLGCLLEDPGEHLAADVYRLAGCSKTSARHAVRDLTAAGLVIAHTVRVRRDTPGRANLSAIRLNPATIEQAIRYAGHYRQRDLIPPAALAGGEPAADGHDVTGKKPYSTQAARVLRVFLDSPPGTRMTSAELMEAAGITGLSSAVPHLAGRGLLGKSATRTGAPGRTLTVYFLPVRAAADAARHAALIESSGALSRPPRVTPARGMLLTPGRGRILTVLLTAGKPLTAADVAAAAGIPRTRHILQDFETRGWVTPASTVRTRTKPATCYKIRAEALSEIRDYLERLRARGSLGGSPAAGPAARGLAGIPEVALAWNTAPGAADGQERALSPSAAAQSRPPPAAPGTGRGSRHRGTGSRQAR
jgi:hypothetical protein